MNIYAILKFTAKTFVRVCKNNRLCGAVAWGVWLEC